MPEKRKHRETNSTSEQRTTKSHAELFPRLAQDLSRLLADPRQFPVILVSCDSTNAAAQLYRILPFVVFHAYAFHNHSKSSINSETRERVTATDKAALARPSVVRLVPHNAALHGPQLCAARETFIDALQTSLCNGPPPTHSEVRADEDDKGDEVSKPEWAARQMNAQAYTGDFLHSLACKEVSCADSQDPDTDEDTAEFSDDGAPETLKSTMTDLAAQLADKDGPATVAGARANRNVEDWMHWVVPLWLGSHPLELRKVLLAWRTVLSGKLACETATLLLFMNPDIAYGMEYEGKQTAPFEKFFTTTGDSVFPMDPSRLRSTQWVELSSQSMLATELLLMANNSPLLGKIWGTTQAERLSNASDEVSAQHAGGCAESALLQVRVNTLPCVRLPRLLCRAEIGNYLQCRESFLQDVFFIAQELNQNVYGCEAWTRNTRRKLRRRKPVFALRIPVSFPSWRWLFPCGLPHLSTHATPAAFSPSLPCGTANATSPIFPCILVSDEAARSAEVRRAVQRNAVNAASLSLMQAAVKTDKGAACDTTVCPLPKPRYYAPVVADGGSPLTKDGCLSDIFVLEFMPDCVAGARWESWARWLRKHPPQVSASETQRRRYRKSLRLVEATEEIMATPLPSRAVTTTFVKAAVELLSAFGLGRGIMSWPLLDPREGHHHPRVAFTMTYEFYQNPCQIVRNGQNGGGRADTDSVATAGTDAGGASLSKPSANACDPSNRTELTIASPAHDRSLHGASFSPLSATTSRYAASSQSYDYSFAASLSVLLARFKRFGWVLVWQEDHRRWPTAVAPPCMIEKHSASFSQYFNEGVRGTAATSGGLPNVPKALQNRVAEALEEWRRDQQRHNMRYDLDATPRFSAAVLNGTSAEDAEFAQSLECGLHSPLFPSPYTSLDVWQAGIVAEEAGVYLWEGQMVFLDNGRCGVIVDFKPPSPKLFAPWTSHQTEEERHFWRGQQLRHAVFIRYYRWRRRLYSYDPSSYHLASAFTSLPSYVTQREQDVYPVVRISSRTWANTANNGSTFSSPPSSSSVGSSKDELVHVLPTRVDTIPFNYPTVCAATAQEQESWYNLHPHVTRPMCPLRNVAWPLTLTSHRHVNQVTLLSLPLSPHRVETCASFFLAQVFRVARRPLRYNRMPPALTKDLAPSDARVVEGLGDQWARFHHDTLKKNGLLSLSIPPSYETIHNTPFGYIRWASFFQRK